MNSLNLDAYEVFHRSWALLTAGTMDAHNAMTISWGGLGCLWNQSVATVYVRHSRYTYEFMENNDCFTVSFYPDECRDALKLLGTLSGRDTDKITRAGLTPVAMGDSVTFAQAKITLLCRKVYHQDMTAENIDPELYARFYEPGEQPHRLYIGKVLEIREG